jgi:ATPase subunit of ABC transporter with duplicated ATPase domains
VCALRSVSMRHGNKTILDEVTLAFLPGARIGVVGPNGMGKSTLLGLMAGIEEPTGGEVVRPPEVSVGILLQEPVLDPEATVLATVRAGVAEITATQERYRHISTLLEDGSANYEALLTELGTLQGQLEHAGAWDLDARLEQAMDALRCPPPGAIVGSLSGGEKRRVALCRLRPASGGAAGSGPRSSRP